MVSCCYNSTTMIWGLLFVDEHYVHDGNDDIYIMMKCLFVCHEK